MLKYAEFNTADGFKANTMVDVSIGETPPMFIERLIYTPRTPINIDDIPRIDDMPTRTYEYYGTHIDPITERETLIYKEDFKT